jgi:hypothetical protein
MAGLVAFVTGLDVDGKVFADKAVEQRPQYVSLKITAVYRAAHIVGNGADLALQGGTLL